MTIMTIAAENKTSLLRVATSVKLVANYAAKISFPLSPDYFL